MKNVCIIYFQPLQWTKTSLNGFTHSGQKLTIMDSFVLIQTRIYFYSFSSLQVSESNGIVRLTHVKSNLNCVTLRLSITTTLRHIKAKHLAAVSEDGSETSRR